MAFSTMGWTTSLMVESFPPQPRAVDPITELILVAHLPNQEIVAHMLQLILHRDDVAALEG